MAGISAEEAQLVRDMLGVASPLERVTVVVCKHKSASKLMKKQRTAPNFRKGLKALKEYYETDD